MEKLIKLLKELTKNKIVNINTATGMVIFYNQYNYYNVLHICAWNSSGDHLTSLIGDDVHYLDVITANHNLSRKQAFIQFTES